MLRFHDHHLPHSDECLLQLPGQGLPKLLQFSLCSQCTRCHVRLPCRCFSCHRTARFSAHTSSCRSLELHGRAVRYHDDIPSAIPNRDSILCRGTTSLTLGYGRPAIVAGLFLTGFVSLTMEIIWTRQYVPFLGPVVYTYAALLVVYLAATFAGSHIYLLRFKSQLIWANDNTLRILLVMAGTASLLPLIKLITACRYLQVYCLVYSGSSSELDPFVL